MSTFTQNVHQTIQDLERERATAMLCDLGSNRVYMADLLAELRAERHRYALACLREKSTIVRMG